MGGQVNTIFESHLHCYNMIWYTKHFCVCWTHPGAQDEPMYHASVFAVNMHTANVTNNPINMSKLTISERRDFSVAPVDMKDDDSLSDNYTW